MVKGWPSDHLWPARSLQHEHALILDLEFLEDVGDDCQLRCVTDQARIAVDGHQPDVLVAADDGAQFAAVLSRRGGVHDTRGRGKAQLERRQFTRGNARRQARRFLNSPLTKSGVSDSV